MPDLTFPKLTASLMESYRGDPIAFIEQQTIIKDAMTGGKTWIQPTLTPLQRKVVSDILLTIDPGTGLPLYDTALLSWGRKMGKTLLAALMWIWKACCQKNELIMLAGPTKNAVNELAFKTAVEVFARNHALRELSGAKVVKGDINIKATGSQIKAVSRSYGAEAGTDWTVCHIDELWMFTSREMTDFHNTITTPSNTRDAPLTCITSYAPIVGKSLLLEKYLRDAKKGDRHFYSSVICGAKEIMAVTPWITPQKLRRAKKKTPPHEFRRVFLNKPTAEYDEQDRYAYSRKQVADVTDPKWSRQLKRPAEAVGIIIGSIDFAPKHDGAVVTAISRMKDRTLALLDMVVMHGSKKNPLPGSWVIDTVKDMSSRLGRMKLMIDPTQLTDQVKELRDLGYEVVEINRKGIEVAQSLWQAIAGARIRFYPEAGKIEVQDGRWYSLEDELHWLMYDPDTLKIWHQGEGIQPGRHYDDRCTTIGMALQAPELQLENTQAISGIQQMQAANAQLAGDGRQQRLFNGQPIRPDASFAPRVVGPGESRFDGRSGFGFRRHGR